MQRLTLTLFLFLSFFCLRSLAKNLSLKSPLKKNDSAYIARLFQGLRKDDLRDVENLLSSGIDPNVRLDDYSALMIATGYGSVSGMQMLLDHGARVNDVNAKGVTALWLAVPNYDRTKLLLDYGADPKICNRTPFSPLTRLVAVRGTSGLLDQLLARGANLRAACPHNELLYLAAGTGDTLLAARLMQAGLSPNDSTAGGDLPLILAASNRDGAMMRMLMAYGADANCAWRPWSRGLFAGITPLMIAAMNNDLPVMKSLLDNGARINARSSRGWTPLLMLEMSEDDPLETAALFLKLGADPALSVGDGSNVFYFASRSTDRRPGRD